MYANFFKHIFDFILALVVGLFFLPIMIVCCILIKINMGGSVIFKQARAGRNDKIFYVCKLKTMTDKKDDNGNLLPDAERASKVGNFLRKTSLDEIPQLINILKGDMSFIGPRPFLASFLPYYTDEERRRHSVRPGITGLAQVNGRNGLSYEDRFKYDLEYVDNVSFIGDIIIVLKTIIVIFSAKNVSYVVTEEFDVQRKKARSK